MSMALDVVEVADAAAGKLGSLCSSPLGFVSVRLQTRLQDTFKQADVTSYRVIKSTLLVERFPD